MKLWLFLVCSLIILQAKNSIQIPRLIWVYWRQGYEAAPPFTKFCAQVMKYYADLNKWEINFISEKEEKKWIKNYTHFRSVFLQKNILRKNIEIKSDFIRLKLLKQYGGVWFDANTLLIQNLNWLENIQKDSNIINSIGGLPSVLLFYHSDYGSNNIQYDPMTKTKVMAIPGFQPWFIAAIPDSQLITDWLSRFEDTLVKGINQLRRIYQTNPNLGRLKGDSYMMISIVLNDLIFRKQNELDKVKKYAVHYYNVWVIDSKRGPLAIQSNSSGQITPRGLGLVSQRIMIDTFEKMEQQQGKMQYFIKVTAGTRVHFPQFPFDKVLNSTLQNISCLQNKKISLRDSVVQKCVTKNSIIYKLVKMIKQGKITKKFENNNIKQEKQNYIQNINQAKNKSHLLNQRNQNNGKIQIQILKESQQIHPTNNKQLKQQKQSLLKDQKVKRFRLQNAVLILVIILIVDYIYYYIKFSKA